MKKFKLLPHAWQSAGWGVVGGGIALLLYSLFPETDSAVFFASTPWTFGCALKTIGFLIIAFSREAFEDERVESIRYNTLGIIAVVYAVMLLGYPAMDVILVYFALLEPMGVAEFSAVRGVVGILPLYVILFKINVWVQNRSLSYEE